MTDHTYPQHGDIPDAANLAQLLRAGAQTSAIVSGLGFTVDYIVPELTVDAGVAVVARPQMSTADPRIDPDETRTNAAIVVELDATTIALDAGATNHVFLDANVGTDSTPIVDANTTNDAPSDESFKIGEVDADVDESSERWRYVAADGTLTFPDESALDDTAANLRHGTVLFDRETNTHYRVD